MSDIWDNLNPKCAMKKFILSVTAIALLVACSNTETNKEEDSKNEAKVEAKTPAESPGYATKVYFGDTHLHTELSMDAGAFGNRIGLDEAYRFAKGEEVTSSSGLTAKLS